jgi:exodeoxyribonuclease VII small subunit
MMRLDEIVTKLNSNQLELEEAMKLFEEGLKLSRQCDNQLKKFENKMNTLLVDEGDKTNE